MRKVVVDTDPGTDDAVALLWLAHACRVGEVELCAVTTCAGNVPAAKTHEIASRLMKMAGVCGVPVGRGVDVVGQSSDGFHGEDGLGGLSGCLPACELPEPRRSSELLVEQLEAGDRTVLCMAALSNLAEAERSKPGVLRRAREIVCMAGAFRHPGNVTASAEFNAWWDPEAVQVVLESGANLVIFPLDVTTQMKLCPLCVKPTGPCSELLRRIVEVQAEQSKAFRETARDEMLLHDASVVMYLLHPHMFVYRRGRVWIETNRASPNRGQTRMERRCVSVQANAWVAESVDTPEMLQLCVADAVSALDSE